jgi:hypothetical protein
MVVHPLRLLAMSRYSIGVATALVVAALASSSPRAGAA